MQDPWQQNICNARREHSAGPRVSPQIVFIWSNRRGSRPSSSRRTGRSDTSPASSPAACTARRTEPKMLRSVRNRWSSPIACDEPHPLDQADRLGPQAAQQQIDAILAPVARQVPQVLGHRRIQVMGPLEPQDDHAGLARGHLSQVRRPARPPRRSTSAPSSCSSTTALRPVCSSGWHSCQRPSLPRTISLTTSRLVRCSATITDRNAPT